MTPLFFAAWLACTPAEDVVLEEAGALAEQFDLKGALDRLRAGTAGEGCDAIAGGVEYLEALLSAPEAVRQGGTDESLRDIRSSVNALSRRAEGRKGSWEIASLSLRAVAAASQSEAAEMHIFLAEATRLEALQRAAQQPCAPFVTAHELAGDLWLQLHRYDDARRAYQLAAERVGRTSRVRLGLARASARLEDAASACAQYQALLMWWGNRTTAAAEIEEARAYAQTCAARR